MTSSGSTAVRSGHLVLIGGNEARNGPMRVLEHMVRLNRTAVAAVIPSASRFPRKVAREYVETFRELGVRDVRVLDIRHREETDQPGNLDRIDDADLVFFTGGDQVRLVRLLRGSRLLTRIRRRLQEGGTVAGTSAGAAAASSPMLFDGQRRPLIKGSVRHGPGFGLLRGVTVDTHFVARNRVLRLAQFLAAGHSRRGIGLAENTGLVVQPDDTAEVVGDGPVIVLRADRTRDTDYHDVAPGDHFSVTGLRLGLLAAGTRFDLRRWTLTDG